MAVTETLSEGLKREYEVIITKKEIEKLVDQKLENIAKEVGLPSSKDAEREILRMISSGHLQASIEQSSGIVHFLDNFDSGGSTDASNEQVELMNYYLSQTMTMTEKVRKLV